MGKRDLATGGKENLVIVESPAKAKTINKYLGSNFKVLASFGHVRDLLPKDGAVDTESDFALQWNVDSRGSEHLKKIIEACRGAKHLYLATDPDREGEAISWHVYEELRRRKALGGVDKVERIVFHEITEQAVRDSLHHPRDLDMRLVDAYLARRVLDYLVGFNLSPVLWRKLPGARSAGRVQSAALRLTCEREQEIDRFESREYRTVLAECRNSAGDRFSSRLLRYRGEALEKFSLNSESQAAAIAAIEAEANFSLTELDAKEKVRRPFAPFTTSTMQQEANRKLGFGASRSMQIAQKLYEGVETDKGIGGLITYMRTDSTALSRQALYQVRDTIQKSFGDSYLPEKPVYHKTKTKNAQEAHEAIRPTSLSLTPAKAKNYLDDEQAALYDLIWKRTIASQMASAVFDVTTALMESADKNLALRSSGTVVKFDGYLKLYGDSKPEDETPAGDSEDGGDDDKSGKALPPLRLGETIVCVDVEGKQHFTKPPPRYSEASLVKKMEEIGIGRPSTYATILKVLRDRDYVDLQSKRFIPTEKGRLVNVFLEGFFRKYVDYEFTADMENNLDDISRGEVEWKSILREFWKNFHNDTQQALDLPFQEVRAEIDRVLGDLFFARDADGSDAESRRCPMCAGGRLGVNYGKYGLFVNCSNYPDCSYIKRDTDKNADATEESAADEYPLRLGELGGESVSLHKGPYGFYVQQGENKNKSKDKSPKRIGLFKGLSPADVNFDIACKLLSLPRLLGTHPDSGESIHAGSGRYGPYLKCGAKYTSLGAEDNVLEIGLNRAVEVIATAAAKGGRRRSEPIKELGEHPTDGVMVSVFKGPYGYYVKSGKVNAGLPKGAEPLEITLAEALDLLEAKRNSPTKRGFRGKKASAKKAGAKRSRAPKSA